MDDLSLVIVITSNQSMTNTPQLRCK